MGTRNESTSSAEEVPVKTSPSLAKALASRVLAAVSGSSTSASFASFDPVTSSLKTCQLSLFEDSMSSSVDLPKAGTMRSGSLYELPTSGRLTDESDCSSWPTATVKGNHNRKGLSPTSGDGLATAAGMWSTPMASEIGGFRPSRLNRVTPGLPTEAHFWATPTARDWKDGACADADVPTNGLLGWQAPRWPTPQAFDARDFQRSPEALARAKAKGGCANLREVVTSFRLDPATTTDGEST